MCLDILDRLVSALCRDGYEVATADVNGLIGRDHLQLGADPPQMLDRTGRAHTAVADGRKRLAVPLLVRLVERVLQHARNGVVVLAHHKDEAVEAGDGLLPAPRFRALTGHPPVGSHLIEEGQRVIA